MEQLSTEEVLLLNNLMYMNSKEPFKDMTAYQGKTLGDLVNAIDIEKFSDETDYTTFTNGSEWKNIIQSVRSDEKLCSTRIESCYEDGNGGVSVLFHNTTDNEAVVVYRGTGSPAEWKDNFQGGSATDRPDGVSTLQQERALEWYQSQNLEGYDSITVSGHSKGGNKAKYITIMDDSVDRCLAFDGQGFSDEFIDKYEGKIAENQYKIHNHNVDGDYVNILLNDVGDTTYYKGYNYGDGKFLENHCPNTYMKYDKNGNFTLVETSQNTDVQNLDRFLNSYLRSIPQNERQDTLNLIGTIVEMVDHGSSMDEILATFTDGSHTDSAAKLLAYFIKYGQKKPELADSIRNILDAAGYGDFINCVNIVESVLNSKYFDTLLNAADWLSGKIPDWILEKLSDYIKEKYSVTLDKEQLKKLLHMIHTVNAEVDQIQIKDDGEDRRVIDASHAGSDEGIRACDFVVNVAALNKLSGAIEGQRQLLAQIARRVVSVHDGLDFHYTSLDAMLSVQEQQITQCGTYCEQLCETLHRISLEYENTEKRILAE